MINPSIVYTWLICSLGLLGVSLPKPTKSSNNFRNVLQSWTSTSTCLQNEEGYHGKNPLMTCNREFELFIYWSIPQESVTFVHQSQDELIHCFLFCLFVFHIWPHLVACGLCPARDQTFTVGNENTSPNHWTAREFPRSFILSLLPLWLVRVADNILVLQTETQVSDFLFTAKPH